VSLHDRLLVRSVTPVLVLTIVATVVGALFAFRPDENWMGLPIGAIMAAAIVATRLGYGRATSVALTFASTAIVLGYVAVGGGVESHNVPYLSLVVFAAWLWTGPRGGIAVTGALVVAMAALGVIDPEALVGNPSSYVDVALASTMAALWLSFVAMDLRTALQQRLASTEALEQSAREAQWDAKARDRFLTMVSHEFRTPLNVVLGYEEMLREEEDNPERIRDLERIHAAGQHLLSLIDDLIDLSATEDVDLPLAVDAVDLEATIAEVGVLAQPLVQLRGNRWSCQPDPDLPRVSADPRRAFQILLNLVSNAAKYTTNGEIVLTAARAGDEVEVAVRDTGVGIDAEKLGELFEPFAQVHVEDQQRPGLGLGLALSQRWARLMNGRIEVDSTVGRGSTFRLYLPVA